MSKLFYPGSSIPKGYTIAITSWENDGDDYDTIYIKGLQSKEIVNEVLHVLQWFCHYNEDMGNEDIQHEEILTRLWNGIKNGTISKEFFDLFLDGVEFPEIGTDEEHDDWLDRVAQSEGYYEVEDMVHGFVGYPVSYDSNFARMVENVSIHFFEEDLKLPNIPNAIIKFSGAWSERDGHAQWKL